MQPKYNSEEPPGKKIVRACNDHVCSKNTIKQKASQAEKEGRISVALVEGEEMWDLDGIEGY